MAELAACPVEPNDNPPEPSVIIPCPLDPPVIVTLPIAPKSDSPATSKLTGVTLPTLLTISTGVSATENPPTELKDLIASSK